ncbi:MAG: ABC transporter permease [Rhodanobacteraceae bacterium]|nr:ABC transporter permease [Rhodanobacteraceae bacterium]
MTPLARAITAECLKLRGTLALWMCLIAPATVVGLYVLQVSFSKINPKTVADPAEPWSFFTQSILALWCFLMLPLFVTLQSALLAGLEHGDNQWKHLLALPLPRRVHYLAKALLVAGMILAGFVVLLLLIPVGGGLLMLLKPAFGLRGIPPWAELVTTAAQCLAASGLIAALQTWIAIRWRSFTVAVAVGMSATVIGFLVGQSERFGHWYPWSMPVQVLAGEGQHASFVVVAGLLGGLAVTALGLADFLRREVG